MILHIINNEYDYYTLLKGSRMVILSAFLMEKTRRHLSRITKRVCRI